MRRRRQSGVVLLVVLALVALSGAALALLAHSARTMQLAAAEASLEARLDCLLASGRAWARQQLARPGGAKPGTFALDAAALKVPGATLTVTVAAKPPAAAAVRIRAACRHGHRTITRERLYVLPAPHRPPRGRP